MTRAWRVEFINNGRGNCSKDSPVIPKPQRSVAVLTCSECLQINERAVMADSVRVSFEGAVLSVEQVPM